MTTAPDRRRGFTLVELLVTLLLIAILAALTTGAVFRVLAGEKNRATEATLSKIETGINQKRSGVLDDAAEDHRLHRMPATLVTFAGGDEDRARVIWTYMRLKNEFPTTCKEARNPVVIPGIAVLPRREVFAQQLPDLPLPVTAEEAAAQSAACLYVSLTAAGVRGVTMSLDGLNQQVADIPLIPTNPAGPTARVFVDSWGQPIAFVRMAYADEVNIAPHTRTGTTFLDPCDPQGKLVQPVLGKWDPTAAMTALWPLLTINHVGAPPAVIVTPWLPNSAFYTTYPMPPLVPQTRNWVMTTVSKGPDGEWGNFFDGDNLVGYRTRREGARGD